MEIKLTCLGVGRGSSYVLRGIPSSSFVISIDNAPFLLVDCGAGVALQYIKHFGTKAPQYIYLTHNHLDHTGDFPVTLFEFFKWRNQAVNVCGHADVLSLVDKHRLHEFYESNVDVDSMVNWKPQNQSNEIELTPDIKLNIFKSQHTYVCHGFNFIVEGKNILAYTGDSGFNQNVYDNVSKAATAIVDGRKNGTFEHASFDEIEHHATKHPSTNFYIIHYEKEKRSFPISNVKYMQEGLEIKLY